MKKVHLKNKAFETEEKIDRPQHTDFGIRPIAGHSVSHGPQNVIGGHENQN